jgi:hypothetical protein
MIDEDDFWSNWWNEIWQGKPKYSEKTYPSATLSTTKSLGSAYSKHGRDAYKMCGQKTGREEYILEI